MAGAALLTVSSSTAAYAGSTAAAVAVMSLLMFAHGFWITNYVTVISETFDRNSVATVMGLAGMVGTVGGMLANTTIGWVADRSLSCRSGSPRAACTRWPWWSCW